MAVITVVLLQPVSPSVRPSVVANRRMTLIRKTGEEEEEETGEE